MKLDKMRSTQQRRQKRACSQTSVDNVSRKSKNRKLPRNRYRDNWYMTYFDSLPTEATPRFPPNRDVALRTNSCDSMLAVRSVS